MVKGHGLYTDIGKKARDVLYEDYHSDKKFTISTYSLTGVHIVRSGKDKRDSYLLEREVENLQLSNMVLTTPNLYDFYNYPKPEYSLLLNEFI
ncbi:unnamed protein product [Lathyrus oleraceus]